MNLVLYSSKSGNTKKLADTVFAALPEPKKILPITDMPTSLADYNLIAFGFWLQAGQPDASSQDALARIQEKDIFLFATHGAAQNSAHAVKAMEFAQELVSSCRVIGTYSCQGEVNPKVIAMAESKPQRPPWLDDAPDAVGHPNTEDLEKLKAVIAEKI